MTEYIKLNWENAPDGEPIAILYEVDLANERLGLRSDEFHARLIEKAEFESIWEKACL